MKLDRALPPRLSENGMHSLRARSIAQPISQSLQVPRRGSLLATYRRSCYIDFDEQIVALVAADLGNGPFTIVLEVGPEYSFRDIPLAELVTSRPHEITIGTALQISLVGAKPWTPALTPWTSRPGPLVANLALCRDLLLCEAPIGSLAHALPWAAMATRTSIEETLCQRASLAMNELAKGLHDGELSALAGGARQLAGLGPGLTPSGDDVLVGVLLALTVSSPPDAEQLRGSLLAASAGRSPRISAAYLDAAAKGEANEAWHQLLDVLPSGDSEAVSSAVRAVMAMGETSGADMLAGFLLMLGKKRGS